jgi:hypothetical protein
MRSVLVAIIMLAAITAFAGNFEDLKAASVRYVAAMKAALALSDDSELIAKANGYTAARKAMPDLLQMAKGRKADTGYGNELTEIFRGFGKEKNEEATGALEAKLNRCPSSDQRDQARVAVDHAKQIA